MEKKATIIWGTPSKAEAVLIDFKLFGEVNEAERQPAIQLPNGAILTEGSEGIEVYRNPICAGMIGSQALYLIDLDAEASSDYNGSILGLIAEAAGI